MPREVDERKTRRALGRLARARAEAEARGETLSDWETGFVESVETRLKTYGSAFCDPEKGDLSEPLSGRQRQKAREIERKARGRTGAKDSDGADGAPVKPRKPFQAKKPMNRVSAKKRAHMQAKKPRVRDIAAELDELPLEDRPRTPPKLRIIDGGG